VAATKPLVQVIVHYSTLIGADDQPAELAGYGPIPADLAREIAADSVWRRLVTDPLSGALLDYGRSTYRPPAGLADFVRARDVTCRNPICRRRVLDCDLDHTIGYHTHGGTTCEANLHGRCRCHHRMKDQPGWSATQHPDGRISWTTPTGHTYTSRPFDYRAEPDLAAIAAAFARAARSDAARDEAIRRASATSTDPAAPRWTLPDHPTPHDDPAPF